MSERRPFFSMPKTAGDLVIYTILVATVTLFLTLGILVAMEK